MRYREWLNEWLEIYVKITNKKRTFEHYSGVVRLHILPQFGEQEIGGITCTDLQKFVSELLLVGNKSTGKGLSASSVNSIITIIQNSMKTALVLGLISKNPAENIRRPKIVEKRIECFSTKEQYYIERAVISDRRLYLRGVVLCLYTGLRIGELLALTWNDIDFRNKMLVVTKSCYYAKNDDGKFSRIVDTPKTNASLRKIPLSTQMILLLKEIKTNNLSDFVIAKNNKPISIRSYQRSFECLLNAIGIPHRNFHALRHTFATRAIECGVDVKTLSEILGHKNATITLNRYTHSLTEHKRNMMNRIGKLSVINIK